MELQDAVCRQPWKRVLCRRFVIVESTFSIPPHFRQRLSIILQQWLYRTLPPSILSLWLSPKPRFLITWVLLPIVLFTFLYYPCCYVFFVWSSRNDSLRANFALMVLYYSTGAKMTRRTFVNLCNRSSCNTNLAILIHILSTYCR